MVIIPREEVASWVQVFPAPPIKSWFCVTVESPVPPRLPGSVPVVFARSMFKVEVAMVPTTPLVAFKRPFKEPMVRVVV